MRKIKRSPSDRMGNTSSNPEQEWECASQLVKNSGAMAVPFSACIRMICSDLARGNSSSLNSGNTFLIERFLRCPGVAVPFYFAMKSLKQEQWDQKPIKSAAQIVTTFTPAELAVLLGVVYLNRHFNRRSDQEEWLFIQRRLQASTNLGAAFGAALPELDLADGLLIGAMRQLGAAPFLMADPKKFRKYRLELLKLNCAQNDRVDLKYWGCTAIQTATLILKYMGFNSYFTDLLGICAEGQESSPRYKTAQKLGRLVDSAVFESALPTDAGGETVIVEGVDLEELGLIIQKFGSAEDQFSWIDKASSDISPEEMPFVFGAKASSDAQPSIDYGNLSAEVRASFSQEELLSLSKDVQSLLS